ncbi:MAG: mannosylglycerate synthase domain-containing protein [Acidimicrobiia bacterium]
MSLAVFPFKTEEPSLVVSNLATAAAHPAIDEVWAVAPEAGGAVAAVRAMALEVSGAHAKPVEVVIQERLGTYRSGKGDAMNTALALAAEQGRDRVHFYDADITNFDASWIDGAERAADRGFGVVRHRFPRAATDAMITWMITRPALARLFPGTFLPRLDQPLGGEVLLTRPAVETLATSDLVRSRSDWGIDTVLTYATSVMDIGFYEHHVAGGKRHALYGSLDELREMLIECLDAAASLSGRPGPGPGARHATDPPAPVPRDLKQIVAYDVDRTVRLLDVEWSNDEIRLAESLPPSLSGLLLDDPTRPRFELMDADRWHMAHNLLMESFALGDPAWESLAFRLWLTRVLSYTTNQARQGFDAAMEYLESTIRRYEVIAAGSS